MDLDFTQEQEILRGTVRALLEKHAPMAVVREMEDDPIGYPQELWNQLARTGLLGIVIPEEYGGAGMSMLDAAIVYEEFGRALTPSPHFPSCVVSASALLASGSEQQKRELLPRIASGETIVTPAWLEPDRGFGAKGVALQARRDGEAWVVSGVKRHVVFAKAASHLLLLARTGPRLEDIDLFLVETGAPGVELTQQMSLASDTQYRVDLREVRVPESARLGDPGSGWRTWHRVMLDGIILLAAQAIGGADRALEMTVEYSKERVQFGKPIGAFQALAHYMADASTAIDGGRTLVYEAAWARSVGRPIDRLAPMAKLFACQTYRDVTAVCEQIHGGMGFTVDCDIQLYFRRAKQLQISWWDSRYLEELVAADVLDRGRAPAPA